MMRTGTIRHSAVALTLQMKRARDGALAGHNQLVSGTPWLFALDAAAKAFDVLIVDEAGQLSIADAIACARAAPNVVLLGDPLQLAQVSQAKHPPGMGLSILEHLLGNDATIPEHRGIFLPESYRMHPKICAFISETVYEGRLQAASGNDVNAIVSPTAWLVGCAGSRLTTSIMGALQKRRRMPLYARFEYF